MAVKGPFGGVGAPTPLLDAYSSSCDHILMDIIWKLHFLYPTKLVGCVYAEKKVEKICQHFLEQDKTHFFGVGAPTPNFDLSSNSYKKIRYKNTYFFHN